MRNISMKIAEWSYVVISFPFLWLIRRVVSPKRLHHLCMGFVFAFYGYYLNNFSYDWNLYACDKTGWWFFCSDAPRPRPELVMWRNMYGVPLFVGGSFVLTIKYIKYVIKVNRRLGVIGSVAHDDKLSNTKVRWLWWL